jgi:hypothetical protein
MDARTITILARLNSNPEFMLTGSRAFGYGSEESDWDYFTKDTPEVINYLTMIGFVPLTTTIDLQGIYDLSNSSSKVQGLNGIMVFKPYEYPKDCDTIHVQLIDSKLLESKKLIQKELMCLSLNWDQIPKEKRKNLWLMGFHLLAHKNRQEEKRHIMMKQESVSRKINIPNIGENNGQ